MLGACDTQAGERGKEGGVDGSSFPPVSHRCMSHCSCLIVCLSRYADVRALVSPTSIKWTFKLDIWHPVQPGELDFYFIEQKMFLHACMLLLGFVQ